MIHPLITDLNSSNCTQRSMKIHYPEFHDYLCTTYPDLSWSEKLYWYYNRIKEYPKCICGNRTKYINFRLGYREFCCYKCMNLNVNNRREQTCIKRYGVKNAMQNDDVKSKLTRTIYEKYGVDNVFRSHEIREKIVQTNLVTRGVPHHMKTHESVDKMLHTRNNIIMRDHPEILSIDDNFIYRIACPHIECNKCNEKWFEIDNPHWYDRVRLGAEQCTRLSPIGQYTKGTSIELFITRFLDDNNIEYFTNVRNIIAPKELDIYIPAKNIAIECNGVYWHSTEFKTSNYHQQKYHECESKGIQLITLWDDWLVNKPDIVISILKSKLGLCQSIFARKCSVKLVDVKTSNHFLQDNHIQGKTPSSVRIGLYYNDELVSLMLFGYRQTMSCKIKDEYDLIRFCNKLNWNVVGGASRLLKYFIRNYHPKSIYSFSSHDISNGNLYAKLGFTKCGSNQSYWYIDLKDMKRYHRSSFTKDSIVKRGWKCSKDGWTESEVMKEHGYCQIYDSGQTKWVLDLL